MGDTELYELQIKIQESIRLKVVKPTVTFMDMCPLRLQQIPIDLIVGVRFR
jgi:hypothetical protein